MQFDDPSDFQAADAAAMDQGDDQHSVQGLLVEDHVALVLVATETNSDSVVGAAKFRITGGDREVAFWAGLVALGLLHPEPLKAV